MKQMKKWLFSILAFGFVLMLCLSASRNTYAGFGDYNDYDSGGDYSDYSSDYSSDWDSDYSDSNWDSDYSDGSGGDSIFSSLVGIIFIVIIFYLYKSRIASFKANRHSQSSGSGAALSRLPQDRTLEIEGIIRQTDSFFTANDFIAYAKRVYMSIQDAWCKRDLSPVRSILHPNLYQQTQLQIEKKIAAGIVNHLDRLTVTNAYIAGYKRDNNYEYLYCYLAARMIDYQVEEATGKILHGNKTTEWHLEYKLTFMRTNGFKTPENKDKETAMICPSCGAPLIGTAFGKCEYCGSSVTTGQYGWVLSDFNLTKNTSFNEGIQLQ